MQFVGREPELKALRTWPKTSKLTAIYGRRRIGKSRLVAEAADGSRFLKFEGLEAQSSANQRRHFRDTLARYSKLQTHSSLSAVSWEDLLICLSEYLGKTPTIVLFDEFQWMASERGELVSTLKFVWDNYFSQKNKIHLILCGSVSSFIVKKVIQSKALFGRIDLQINLGPLSLGEVRRGFFPSWSRDEVLKIYLALGGVPKYLELCDTGKSFEQNILDLFFSPLSPLISELDSLFVSHFGKNKDYSKVIAYMAGRKYASRKHISAHLDQDSGGGVSTILADLEMAGFIAECRYIKGFKRTKSIHYRICDPFLRFFFKFVHSRVRKIKALRAPMNVLEALPTQSFHVWQGFAFEGVCHGHADSIARALGFGAVDYEYGSVASGKLQPELDLVYSRKDGVMTICEIKSGKSVDLSVIKQVRDQIESLQGATKKTINAALIATGKVDSRVQDSRLFIAILGLDSLLS